ncbi:MAG: glycosyltransferase family 39 protein [Ruminococcus flavefaciens]|nr:glycosyltransferase family 39 protein [Ruminococcus flavefaciens]
MRKFIIICMVILCACVFPVSLVRKSGSVGTVMSGNFGSTDCTVQEFKQVFTAQTSYLEKIAFDVGIAGDSAEGKYCVIIEDEDKQKMIAEKYISFQDACNGGYTYVPIGKWLRKGGEYSVSITAEGVEGFFVIYSLLPEEAAPGSQRLYLNGELSDNQAVMEYTYMFPLNIKNVACLWAFIWIGGLSLLGMLKKKEIGEDLPVVRKLHELLDRFQILFLLIESAVILFLIIKISGTDAVDWDEAYTWWITTKNTIPEMIIATAADVHPPLYYLLVKAAMAVFGKNIVVARMVSVAGAAATCLLVSTLVRKRFGVKAASLLLLVVGLGTQMIYYNVNVRMYSWMIFFVMAAGLSAYEIMIDGKAKSWILFVLFSLGGGIYPVLFGGSAGGHIYLSADLVYCAG